MVADFVEDYLHAEVVSSLDESAEVVDVAEFRIDSLVVGHSVVATEFALAIFFADRVDRHQPEDVDAEFFESWQFFAEGLEGATFCALAEVNFVDHSVFAPFGVANLGLSVAIHHLLSRDRWSKQSCHCGKDCSPF